MREGLKKKKRTLYTMKPLKHFNILEYACRKATLKDDRMLLLGLEKVPLKDYTALDRVEAIVNKMSVI